MRSGSFGITGRGTLTAFSKVCGRMLRYETAVYRPEPNSAAIYDKLYALYLELHDYIGLQSNLCEKLTRIRV